MKKRQLGLILMILILSMTMWVFIGCTQNMDNISGNNNNDDTKPANPTDLSFITLSKGILSPGFSSGVTEYTAFVENDAISITATPTGAYSNSTIKVIAKYDGMTDETRDVVSSNASESIILNLGENKITIQVIATDNSTKNYVVTVTKYENSELSNLTISSGTLSPGFASGTTEYNVTVDNNVASVTVTPTKADAGASIDVQINDGGYSPVTSGIPSGSLSLNVGINTIDIKVTAEDSTTTLYTITVIKKANSCLSALTTSLGTLNPTFASETTAYTVFLTNDVNSINITPTKADAGASIKVNTVTVASGTSSLPISLNVGSNAIIIEVTASDSTATNYVITVTRSRIETVTITGGTFEMGWAGIAEATHDVTLSDFIIGKYELTYEIWENVRTWAISNGYTFSNNGVMGNDGTGTNQHPVTTVDWYDAVVWCNALSELEGLTPCYYTEVSQTNIYKNATTQTKIFSTWVKWDANGFRLPTEAQWEFAARNGGASPGDQFSGYVDGTTLVGDYAWYDGNSGNKTHPVGLKNANQLGLYDMSGNVFEFCWDFDGGDYINFSPYTDMDSKGATNGTNRIIRSGANMYPADWIVTSMRWGSIDAQLHKGFRVVRGQ